jgi:hypothetical protein
MTNRRVANAVCRQRLGRKRDVQVSFQELFMKNERRTGMDLDPRVRRLHLQLLE